MSTEPASKEDSKDKPEPEAEEGFWASAGSGDFDDGVAEEHASKIFALWELGDEFKQAVAPASGDAAEDGEGGWRSDPNPPKPAASEPAAASPAAAAKPTKKLDQPESAPTGEPAVTKAQAEPTGAADVQPAQAEAEPTGTAAEAPTTDAPGATDETTPDLLGAAAGATAGETGAGETGAGETGAGETKETEAAQAGEDAVTEGASADAESSMVVDPAVAAAPATTGPAVDLAATLVDMPQPVPVPTPPAPEPVPAAASPFGADEAVELPSSGNTTIFLVAGAAVLLLIVGGIAYAFTGGDDPAPRASAQTQGPPEVPEPAPEPASTTNAPAIGPTGAQGSSGQVASADDQAVQPVEGDSADDSAADDSAADDSAADDSAADDQTAAAGTDQAEAIAAAEPVEPPPPATAHITVRTVPATATLTMDGEPVSNPYQGDLEIAQRVRFAATADGHRPAAERIRVRSDRELVLTLRERPAASATPRNTRSSGRRRSSTRRSTARRSRGRSRRAGFTTANPYD